MAQLTALTNFGKNTIANSGASELSVMVPIEKINLKDEFKNLFPFNESMVDIIAKSIVDGAYDKSQPIHVWKEGMILVDGHHRLEAAKRAGLKEIPVFYHHFKNLEGALMYAIKMQTDRRNLSDAELLKILQTLDQLKQAGRSASYSDEKSFGKSAEITAQKIGVSRSKVERARTVQNKASEEIKKAIEQGEMSINAAYNATVKTDKKPKRETFKEWINVEHKQPELKQSVLFVSMIDDEVLSYHIYQGSYESFSNGLGIFKTFENNMTGKYWLPLSVLPAIPDLKGVAHGN